MDSFYESLFGDGNTPKKLKQNAKIVSDFSNTVHSFVCHMTSYFPGNVQNQTRKFQLNDIKMK